ncbi:NUDIX domain-containing protein [Micromonospora sp. NPDC003197]
MPESELMSPLVDALSHYRPETATETDDVARVRSLLSSAENPWHRSTPLHLTVSAGIVHPPSRRVLLRWHVRQQAWLLVGGHADPGETDPGTVAVREGQEETGLTDLTSWPAPDAAPIVHVVVVPVAPSDTEPAHEHADLRFVLATNTPDAIRPENPTAELRWLSVPEALATTTKPNIRETLTRVGRLLGN